MSSVMKIDLDVSTEKAKKSLQQLAKETSKNLQVQQTRTQQNFQRGQQQGSKGNSNLLGLAALGTSMVAVVKATEKHQHSIEEVTKKKEQEKKVVQDTSKALEQLRKEAEHLSKELKLAKDGKYFGSMASREGYRRYRKGVEQENFDIANGFVREDYSAIVKENGQWVRRRHNNQLLNQNWLPPSERLQPREILSYREWATQNGYKDKAAQEFAREHGLDEIIPTPKGGITGNKLRRSIENRIPYIKNLEEAYEKSHKEYRRLQFIESFRKHSRFNPNANSLKNLTYLQEQGLGIRDWMAKKALGLNTRLGGLPIIGGMLGSVGTSMSGAISSIPSSMLGALGAGGSVASALAAPIAAAIGGYFAGGKMIDAGRQAQSQREQLNASLGQMQFNMSGTRDVSALTDNIMKMSISGVNSVQDLNAATSALMMSFEGNTDKVQEFLPLIDDLAAATGVTASQMGEMIARVNEAGVAESRVINSLSTKGIPIYRALGEAMGVTTQEAKKMAKEGTISAATFEKALQNLGKTVKGTSAALSSMTLEGAQNSFDAAESLAYASATEAADRSRIEMLNRMTDETMKEVENLGIQQLRAAAGHGTQAVKNAAFEAWDGIGDFFTDMFGSAMVYLGGHSAASSSLNREINKKVDEMQEVTDEMAADAISKQIEALENYNKQLRDKMSFEVMGIDFMLDSTRAELEKTTRAIDNLIQERIRLHREAVEREQAQREVDAERIKKEFDAIPERLERERNSNVAQKQREMDRTLWERILNSDNFEGEGGRVAAGMAAQGILSSILPGITLDNAEEKMGELYQSIHENPLELGTLLDDVEAVREVMKRYQEVLEDITRKEQERAEQLRQEARERERTNLQFAAAMGDKSAAGELQLYDRAYEISDNKYLTDLEKEWWIEEEANRLLREMQATTEKGVHLGNGIYGCKELPDNTASKGWVHNAWGAACRSFYNYEKNYDKEQYDELRKNTTANQETARGILNLTQRFGITAQ